MSTKETVLNQEIIRIREQILPGFLVEEKIREVVPFGNGHINDTYRIMCECEDGSLKRYILQRMNVKVFKKPYRLMENVDRVTAFLREKIRLAGGDEERETLTLIPGKNGELCIGDERGDYWRVYLFIEDAICLEAVRNAEDFYNSAIAFGNFQYLLSDYPAQELYETIPDFHNTVKRFEQFTAAVREDVCGRRKDVEKEIQFVLDREEDCRIIVEALAAGEIPLRVTHNDTKLNNIMFDAKTGEGICIMDLDTVMPGSILYDYGDSIRFGASTGAEDEKNLDKIFCDMELFDAYTRGYIEGCKGCLTEREIELMPVGAKLMTLECGMRFLADYLQNDVYYKIAYADHNLDRARTQFKLVQDMEEKWQQMQEIVAKYR